MVVKVYISGISGNKEVKKRQQRVLMILDSKNIKYDVIDITEPGKESDKDFMQNNSKSNGGTVSDPNPRSPLPPQVFNDEEYCGDYDQFDLANEVDTLEQFLKLEAPPEEPPQEEKENAVNGDVSKGTSQERETQQAGSEKESSPATTADAEKEPSPAKDAVESIEEPTKEESPAKEIKETSPERQKSEEKSPIQETEVESKKLSKENTPVQDDAVNENGTVSSREQSAEKEETSATELKKETSSEALIASEQAAASD